QPHQAFQVEVDSLQLGGIIILNMSSRQRDLNIDGILGDDVIGKLVWKVDFFNRKVYVTDEISNFQVGKVGFPMKRKENYIYLECYINGVKTDLVLDTGYSGFISLSKEMTDSLFEFKVSPIFWEGISTLNSGNPYASASFEAQIDSTYY